jgi:cell division protease FtsH
MPSVSPGPDRLPPGPPAPGGTPQPPPRRLLIWWLLLGTLLAWNFLLFWPRPHPEAAIPYSTFLAQVRARNVSGVHVVGARIAGTFVEPVTWPPKDEQAAKEKRGAKEEPATPAVPPQPYTKFVTTFPSEIGDPSLLALLEEHHVEVDVTEPRTPWLVELLVSWGPLLLLLGVFLWFGRQGRMQQSGLFGFGRSRARRYGAEQPKVTFNDVAGADEAKQDLEEEVDFLRHPKKYHDLGARIPRGVLLVGPPGTGKTLLARAVAGEAGVPFFSLSGSEFVEMFVGVGASRVRDLFTQAKAAAPAIVFIDELDAVGRRRGAGLGAVNDEREQTLNQLLVEMDGFDERQEVIILAATNRPDVLDPALLRPGRFDRHVEVGLPDRRGREGILRIHTRKLHLANDIDLDRLARATTGLSGADLANLCNEAALIAARKNRSEVSMEDFGEAQDKVVLGGARSVLLGADERRVVAYHEAGHALVAWLTPAADDVNRVTIVPHGRALGVTQQIPGEERHNFGLAYLRARLAVMLGGRTAEEIAIGDLTTGAENDLVEATRLARRMISRWGMGSLGLAAFRTDDRHPFLGYELAQGRDYSEATAAEIDREVQRLLDERHRAVHRLLSDAREQLDALVVALLHDETVDRETIERILGPRPPAEAAPGEPATQQAR